MFETSTSNIRRIGWVSKVPRWVLNSFSHRIFRYFVDIDIYIWLLQIRSFFDMLSGYKLYCIKPLLVVGSARFWLFVCQSVFFLTERKWNVNKKTFNSIKMIQYPLKMIQYTLKVKCYWCICESDEHFQITYIEKWLMWNYYLFDCLIIIVKYSLKSNYVS